MKTPILLVPFFALGNVMHAEAELKPIEVGERIPAVTLETDAGASINLAEATAGKPAVLVFYRGGWCPYCTRHLSALAEVEAQIVGAGCQLIAISPDQPSKLRAKPTHVRLNYTLLSDSRMDAAKQFGIAFQVPDELVSKYRSDYGIDLEGDSGQTHHLLPHPAVFVVDSGGVIRFAHVNPDYKVRLSPAEILDAIRTVAE
ncbi:MAG TPA: peroxiredoxin-like family protein [Opitutaceae bacterium]